MEKSTFYNIHKEKGLNGNRHVALLAPPKTKNVTGVFPLP